MSIYWDFWRMQCCIQGPHSPHCWGACPAKRARSNSGPSHQFCSLALCCQTRPMMQRRPRPAKPPPAAPVPHRSVHQDFDETPISAHRHTWVRVTKPPLPVKQAPEPEPEPEEDKCIVMLGKLITALVITRALTALHRDGWIVICSIPRIFYQVPASEDHAVDWEILCV